MRKIAAAVGFLLAPVAPAIAAPEYLTADRTYWVRTDGNDENDCLSDAAAGACATWQAAYLKAAPLDFDGRTVTIRAGGSGERSWAVSTGDVLHIDRPWRGWGGLRIVGDVTTPANVRLTATAGSVFRIGQGSSIAGMAIPGVPLPGPIFIEGFDVRAPNGFGLRHAAQGDISIGHMIWGPAYAHFGTEWFRAAIRTHGPYTINGGGQQHIFGDAGAVNVFKPITVIGNLTFDQTIYCQHGGFVLFNGDASWNLTNGSIAGRRFLARENATCQGNSSDENDLNWFPGSTPGVTETGGVYIPG